MVFLKIIFIFAIEVLLTFLCGMFALNANDAIMLKFHQSAYKVRNERAEVISINREYMNILSLRTFKFNRTVTAFNITVSSKYDIESELDVVLQAYKRASNEYRLFPMRMRINFCKYFENNIFGLLKNAMKCGNVTRCRMEKDLVYQICNFVLDVTKVPPLIPTGEYKIEITALYKEVEIAVLDAYTEIYYPMKVPKI